MKFHFAPYANSLFTLQFNPLFLPQSAQRGMQRTQKLSKRFKTQSSKQSSLTQEKNLLNLFRRLLGPTWFSQDSTFWKNGYYGGRINQLVNQNDTLCAK